MAIHATGDLRQAADPTKTAGLTPYDAICRAPTLLRGAL